MHLHSPGMYRICLRLNYWTLEQQKLLNHVNILLFCLSLILFIIFKFSIIYLLFLIHGMRWASLYSWCSFDDGPLIEPDRFIDVREFCRCGITNFGAGCRVHWGGGIELADVWRVNAGRFIGADVVTWMDAERIGAGTLFRGGIAGGGPRGGPVLVTEFCRGGIWGSAPFDWSADGGDFDVMLEVRWRIAEVAFDMDCVMELCVVFGWGWTAETIVVGFCGWTFTICCFAWGWMALAVPLLLDGEWDDWIFIAVIGT